MSDWRDDLNAALEKEEERKDIIKKKAEKEKEMAIRKQYEKIDREFFIKTVKPAFIAIKSIIEKKKDVEMRLPDNIMRGRADFIVYAKDTKSQGNIDKEFHYMISAKISPSESVITSTHCIYVGEQDTSFEGKIQSVKDYTTISVDDICEDITIGYKKMVEKALES